jgi:hypothetical protein
MLDGPFHNQKKTLRFSSSCSFSSVFRALLRREFVVPSGPYYRIFLRESYVG